MYDKISNMSWESWVVDDASDAYGLRLCVAEMKLNRRANAGLSPSLSLSLLLMIKLDGQMLRAR